MVTNDDNDEDDVGDDKMKFDTSKVIADDKDKNLDDKTCLFFDEAFKSFFDDNHPEFTDLEHLSKVINKYEVSPTMLYEL